MLPYNSQKRITIFLRHLLTLGSMLLLVGCMVAETSFIVPTKVVSLDSDTPRQVTRVVTRVVSPTMVPVIPTALPPVIHVYFAPDDALSDVHQKVASLLGSISGLETVAFVPQDYSEAIGALCAGRADLAWLATPAYLLAQEQCACLARFAVLRDGRSTYRAQIMVQADALRVARGLTPLHTLMDLDGKRVGYTAPGSPTGYYFPKAMLVQGDVHPLEEVFWGGDGQAVLAVYRGEVDAAVGYWAPLRSDGSVGDSRRALLDAFPDVADVVRVLQLSEPAPNDPVVFAADLDKGLQERLFLALLELAQSPEGQALLSELYGIEGLGPVTDQDYDVLRRMTQTLEIGYATLLQESLRD